MATDCATVSKSAVGRAPIIFGLALAGITVATAAEAGQTFNEAVANELVRFGSGDSNGGGQSCARFIKDGTPLLERCAEFPQPGGPGGAGSAGSSIGGTFAAPDAVLERLKTPRAKKGGGGSADAAVSLGNGFSVFAVPGYERLNHSNNRYEDGYKADIGRLTLGGDYKFSQMFFAGIAFDYAYQDGVYDEGRGYNTSTYGVLLYGSILPVENVFIDLSAGYGWSRSNDSRVARLFNPDGSQLFPPPGNGSVRSDYNGNQLTASVRGGYDYPIQNITIGPRAGFTVGHWTRETYREEGVTGLELEYANDSQTSLQSNLGAAASIAVSTSFGVLLPQIEGAWVHEFADDQRSQKARFRDALPSEGNFRYDSESPDRNFGVVGVGLTAVLPNGLQPFAAFRSIVGNDNYNSYAVSAGLRLEL
ncbi:MAG: autotransporter outer membrane beta-barrel domain-containing protein [Candidatus Accumulibacter sp.]|uniref:autotransporter outer membrane beta-barrel domain-containing protein n=1 Tax=Accumulibacter sp. TaxID=2053492 RepID=UPI00287B0B11|nr:autotransporter outer membrane beta-barrel domain-containing protein [Accumulibacter sp.]MDS4016575.1 autotransporter outer membrane beta-barrel domain-containing protein [Accumulibacter sp.]